jgi:hypothetical protein
MPGVDHRCTTHHYACDCREAAIKFVAERLLSEHDELAKFKSGFGKPRPCFCAGCQEARKLMAISVDV